MYRVADNRCLRGAEEKRHKHLIPRSVVLRNKAPPITTYQRCREPLMFDAIMIAIALGFFALSVGYTIACDRL
jgi:hypothetical protein